jgi:UDP-glucose 4-epimerase
MILNNDGSRIETFRDDNRKKEGFGMSSKYFVSGGAGFVGSHLVRRLLPRHKVVVYDNLSSDGFKRLTAVKNHKNFCFIKGDLLNLPRLVRAMKGSDVVFHLASNPDIAKSMKWPRLDVDQGLLTTFNVLEAMRLTHTQKLFYTSGSGVYGDLGSKKVEESMGPSLPISMYGASKLGCEGMISAYSHMYGINSFMFRIANIVGGQQTHGVAYDFIRRLKKDSRKLTVLGDGWQSKSYIHVDDLLDAMFFVSRKHKGSLGLYNVATDDYLNVRQIARMVLKEMNCRKTKVKYLGGKRGWKGDVPIVRFNLSKIHRLGWKSKLNSAGAMRASICAMIKEL